MKLHLLSVAELHKLLRNPHFADVAIMELNRRREEQNEIVGNPFHIQSWDGTVSTRTGYYGMIPL